MIGAANHASAPGSAGPTYRILQVVPASLILASLAIGLVLVTYRYAPPSPELVVVGGAGAVGILSLAIARYDVAVALGLVLFGFLNVDPAPPDIIFSALVCVALVTGRFTFERLPLTVGALLGAYFALNLVSTIEAPDPGRAVSFIALTVYVGVLAVWLTGYVNSEQRARWVVLAYLGGAVISALLGVLPLLFSMPGAELFVYSGERARGLAYDPNVYGPYLVPIALILLEELAQPRLLRMRRSLKLFLLLILLSGILFSFSRGAWLNFGVAFVVLITVLLLRRSGRTTVAILASVIAALAVVVAVLVASGSIEIIDERVGVQSYDVERFGAQEAGLELAEQHPLGIGPGQFESYSPVSAHSIYVRALAEQGILGLATLIGLALATLAYAARSAALGRHTFGIGSAALLAAWCGLLVNSVFVDTIHWRTLWLVAALIWVGAMRRSTGSAPT